MAETRARDRWSPARKLARQIYRDHRDGVAPILVGDTRNELRRAAFLTAVRRLNIPGPPHAVTAAADRFADARR